MSERVRVPGRSLRVGIVWLAVVAAATAIAGAQTPPRPPSLVSVYAGSTSTPAVTIQISPAAATVAAGGTVQFVASVIGTSNTTVTWSATGGNVTDAGVFTAGTTPGAYAVTATISGGSIASHAPVTIVSPVQAPTSPTDGLTVIDVLPGQSIQQNVDAMPAGTAFRLKAGVHRLVAPVIPKDGNVFVGEAGTVVSGARLLTTFSRSGSYWVASGQTQQGQIHGACTAQYPRCLRPEDLYIDHKLLRHVAALAEVAPGRWYFDYDNDRIYMADDPTGHTVETTVTRHGFGGTAQNVVLSGLVVEKFANPAQAGAVEGDNTRAWVVQDSELRFNHGVGVRLGEGMQLLRNRIHHNGQMGVGGVGSGVLVEGNEIAFNNTNGFEVGWEAGGTKFVATVGLIVRRNWVHHNIGPGLWTDINNRQTLYEENRVESNTGNGIFHEVSYAAVIRNNTIWNNGTWTGLAWTSAAGIVVSASPDVEIHGNTLSGNGMGILAIQQNRANEGAYGQTVVQNLNVHDNNVLQTSAVAAGLLQDVGDNSYFTSRNNRFENNTYTLGTNQSAFAWMNQQVGDSTWRSYGQDVGGLFIH